MFGFILKFLSGGVLDFFQGMVGKYLSHKSTKVKAAASITVAQIEAERDVRIANKEIIIAEQGRWYTRIVRPCLALPLCVHFGAITFVSTFPNSGFAWEVHALPAPMHEWEGVIILSYFMARPVEKIGTKIANRLTR